MRPEVAGAYLLGRVSCFPLRPLRAAEGKIQKAVRGATGCAAANAWRFTRVRLRMAAQDDLVGQGLVLRGALW